MSGNTLFQSAMVFAIHSGINHIAHIPFLIVDTPAQIQFPALLTHVVATHLCFCLVAQVGRLGHRD